MINQMLLIVSVMICVNQLMADGNETQENVQEVPVRRPLNFVVARKGDNPLTSAKKIDDPEAWFLQRRKRLLAIQRKLFAARRNHFIPGHLPTPFTNNTSLGLKSKRLDYLRKPSSAFLLANKASLDKPLKYKSPAVDHQVYFVSLPVIVPPATSDPFEFHGPPQTCIKGKSGFLCCNRTLEDVILSTYEEIRNRPAFSHFNMHRITKEVQKATEQRFGCPFEVIATGGDFVSKSNFNGDLNCKVRVDGKVILAYSTPKWRASDDIELIDASGLLSADGPVSVERTTIAADKLAQIRQRLAESTLVSSARGDNLLVGEEQKPIFLVYGPIR